MLNDVPGLCLLHLHPLFLATDTIVIKSVFRYCWMFLAENYHFNHFKNLNHFFLQIPLCLANSLLPSYSLVFLLCWALLNTLGVQCYRQSSSFFLLSPVCWCHMPCTDSVLCYYRYRSGYVSMELSSVSPVSPWRGLRWLNEWTSFLNPVRVRRNCLCCNGGRSRKGADATLEDRRGK